MANSSYVYVEDIFVSNNTFIIVVFWLVFVGLSIISIVAILTNAMNQVIFVYMDLKEHVNFTLFCLSLSELFAGLTTLLFILFSTNEAYALKNAALVLLSDLFSWGRVMFSNISVAFILFISVERSLCVTFPFTFKMAFNIHKTRSILLVITIVIVACFIPVYSTRCFYLHVDSVYNNTYIDRCDTMTETLGQFIGVLFGLLLSVFALVCTFVSVVTMHVVLRRSSLMRKKMAGSPARKDEIRDSGMSQKERKVVRLVLTVAITFFVTHIPKAIYNIAGASVPALINGPYKNLFNLIALISYVTETINSCSHIFIYYTFNTNYRTRMHNIFRGFAIDKFKM